MEGVLKLSGVLATVASSLVLAHHMWPYVVSPESMHCVWHTWESLGNMVVFFLAGAKTGYIFLDIKPINWLYLCIIYIFLVFLRGAIIFGSRPILQYLSADKMPVTWQDATLMTWGGLRGAVGLALALAVDMEKAPHIVTGEQQITDDEAQLVLFFVAGIAFFTTMINATTAPTLVGWLQITAMPQARQTLVKMFHSQLVTQSEEKNHPAEVTEALKEMLHEAYHHIAHQQVSKTGPVSQRSTPSDASHDSHGHDAHDKSQGVKSNQSVSDAGPADNFQSCDAVVAELIAIEQEYTKEFKCEHGKEDLHSGLLGEDLKEGEHLLLDMAKAPGEADIKKAIEERRHPDITGMMKFVQGQWTDVGMAKVVNEIFLSMVYKNYWKLIDDGNLRPGSPESEVLLTSVRVSLSPYRADLADYEYLSNEVCQSAEFADEVGEGDEHGIADAEAVAAAKAGGAVSKLIISWQFNLTVGLMILLNTLQVIAEEIWREEGKKIDKHVIWLILDGIFSIFFLVEFVLKFSSLFCVYFRSNWNRFDFFLVWVGVFGFVTSLATHGQEGGVGGKVKILKVARVLRTLRFLRIFRLFHARMNSDKYISMELARHMKKITALDCFIRAHVMAQKDLVLYLGGNGQIDEEHETEIARCVLQSQICTYRALVESVHTREKMGQEIFLELEYLHERRRITESLTSFILKAHKDGALSATEAHAILHPLNHLIAETTKTLARRAEGVMDRPSQIGAGENSGNLDKGGGHDKKRDSEAAKLLDSDPSPKPPDTSLSMET